MAGLILRVVSWATLLGTCRAASCPWAEAWEWAGVFHIHEGGMLLWSAQKADGAYADASMRLVIRSTSTANAAGLEAQHQAAAAAWNSTTAVTPSTVLTPDNAYTLTFDADSWVSLFKIQVQPETNLAFFAEHMPSEFTSAFKSFLINEEGEELSAAVEESAAECAEAEEAVAGADIGEVVGASLVTMLPTLLGICLFFFTCKGHLSERSRTILHFLNAGASGILFGASVFLLLPEAHHMLGAAVGTESGGAAVWGSTVIGGWLLGAVTHQSGDMVALKCFSKAAPALAADVEAKEAVEEEEEEGPSTWGIATPVLLADFFCNLADGFVVGAAFRFCGWNFGWKLAVVTMAHEIPMELADFFVLVRKAGLSWFKATALNFAIGLAAVLGAVISFYMETSNSLEGAMLALGGGVFFYIALTELGPAVSHIRKGSRAPILSSLGTLLAFLLGATFLGVVLTDHEHCYVPVEGGAADEADSHAGHHGQ